jgi:hypothetical protein
MNITVALDCASFGETRQALLADYCSANHPEFETVTVYIYDNPNGDHSFWRGVATTTEGETVRIAWDYNDSDRYNAYRLTELWLD